MIRKWFEESPWPEEHPVLALGFFDGFHRGHRALLAAAGRESARVGEPVRLMSFSPHPCSVIPGAVPVRQIYTDREKEWLNKKHRWFSGEADLVFDTELMRMSPETFVEEVLFRRYRAASVVVGADFRFGRDNSGSAQELAALCRKRGMDCLLVDPVMDPESKSKISSKVVRQLLEEGRMEQAASQLGEPFCLVGTVEHGKGIGHRELVPTANLPYGEQRVCIPHGVYVSQTCLEGEEPLLSVTNVGTCPSMKDSADRAEMNTAADQSGDGTDTAAERAGERSVTAETFLLDRTVDLYGREVVVRLLSWLRPEQFFEDVSLLREQQQKDIKNVRLYAKEHAVCQESTGAPEGRGI